MQNLNVSLQRKQIVVVILLILCSLLLLVGDLALPTVYEDTSYLTPASEKTRQAFDIRTPIINKLQAAIAGQIMINTGHFSFVSTPIIRSVEEISLAEAKKRLADFGIDHNPPDAKVWLVVMQGDIQIVPPPPPYYQTMTPTPWIVHDGCGFVLFDAQGPADPFQVGGIECPSR